MQNATKLGRRRKPFTTRDGRTIDGLYRAPNGVYRVVKTGYQFRCQDEAEAIARFYKLTKKTPTTFSYVPSDDLELDEVADIVVPSRAMRLREVDRQLGTGARILPGEPATQEEIASSQDPLVKSIHSIKVRIPDSVFYDRMREELTNNLATCAERTGIPHLLGLASFAVPTNISLKSLMSSYKEFRAVSEKTKRKTEADFKQFCNLIQATTTNDITTAKALSYLRIMQAKKVSSITLANTFSRVKVVFAYAIKKGYKATDINPVLDALKVLHVEGRKTSKYKPMPISKENFWKLHGVGKDREKAILLLALNGAYYLQEILDLRWEDIDFDHSTICVDRHKTGIIRACYLWQETIDALHKIKPPLATGPILKSKYGTAYNASAYRELWAELREKAGVGDVKFCHIRDGSFSAAAARCDEMLLKLLVGHSVSSGDNYIKRNPAQVKPATDAVYAAYFPAC